MATFITSKSVGQTIIIYVETSTLMSYEFEKLKGKKVSLWSRVLSQSQKDILKKLYYDDQIVLCRSNYNLNQNELLCMDTNF